MREIIKTYKNYDKDIYEEVKCMKPNQSIRGNYKVELFDDLTGRKVEECIGENVITNALNKYWMQFNFIMAHCNQQTPAYDSNGYFSPFGNLYLTNSTSTESVTTKRVLGDIIGWANRNVAYAGTSTLRGTTNAAERIFSNDCVIKHVFDWPTHAANGTFQSLFWTPANVNTVTTQVPPLIGIIIRHSTGSVTNVMSDSNARTCVYNNEIYYTGASGLIYKITKTLTGYGFETRRLGLRR